MAANTGLQIIWQKDLEGAYQKPERDGGNQREACPHPALGATGFHDQDSRKIKIEVVHGRQSLSQADLLLKGVYGDYPHDRDGCSLTRDIQGDQVGQDYWRRLASQNFPRNFIPQVKQGNAFVLQLASELDGVREG